MSNPPPFQPPVASYAVRDLASVDREHLRMLAICHYIWAGLLVPFACFGLIYVGMGALMTSGRMNSFNQTTSSTFYSPYPAGSATTGVSSTAVAPTVVSTPPVIVPQNNQGNEIVGYFFMAFGGVFVVLGLTLAVCTLIAGRSLAKRRRRTFVLIVAALNCLMFPIGTALGVFTLIVVLRESVRQLFDPTTRVADAV